ncbi:hypothetical protein [Streptomyces sp. NPDC047803]|uniref:hypothetical protein n=1 Tax=unclassified Streptomyces TaxID=2593676 RepID=UPI0033E7C362
MTVSEEEPADFRITLQGRNAQAVVVTGVEVKVLSSKPLPKSGFIVADGCGGLIDPRAFTVKFSSSSAKTEPVPDMQGKKVDFPLQVSESDPEFIDLVLLPGNHDIRYTVEVKWLSDGEPGGKLLDNDGAGYRIMGRGELPNYGLFNGDLARRP